MVSLPQKSFRMGEIDPVDLKFSHIPQAVVCIDISVGMEFRMYARGVRIAEGDRFELAARLSTALGSGCWIQIKKRVENEDK